MEGYVSQLDSVLPTVGEIRGQETVGIPYDSVLSRRPTSRTLTSGRPPPAARRSGDILKL
eukprot:637231-Amorphochlora_amoeboformis.AAC.1